LEKNNIGKADGATPVVLRGLWCYFSGFDMAKKSTVAYLGFRHMGTIPLWKMWL
jgi:hypothetical protein